MRKLNKNMAVISALSDLPNATDGLSAASFKEKFDENGITIKNYINNELIPDIETLAGTKENSADITNKRKLDENGNFTGSWFGFKNPVASEPGIQAQVNANTEQLEQTVKKGEIVINVKDYGAVGDGVVDDTSAIMSAIAAANEGSTIIIPSGSYKTTSTILVNKNINFVINGILVVHHEGVGIEFSNLGRGTLVNCSHRVNVRKATVNHVDETSIGVKINSCYSQRFLINLIKDFNYGLKLEAELGKGCVYNEFEILVINNNKKGIYLSGINNGPTDPEKSWPNQNTFIGGRISWSNSTQPRTGYVGIQIGDSASGYICNGNVFFNTSVEDVGSSDGSFATPIRCFGHSNMFYSIRTEGGLQYVFEVSSYNNKCVGGFYTTLKDVIDTGQRNEFDFARGGLRKWVLDNQSGNEFIASGSGVHAAKFYSKTSADNPIVAVYETDGITLAAYMKATGEMQWRKNVKHIYGLMNAAPTTGTWQRNDVVWRNNPSANQYIGWVCVASGSPGTWKGFGMIEA